MFAGIFAKIPCSDALVWTPLVPGDVSRHAAEDGVQIVGKASCGDQKTADVIYFGYQHVLIVGSETWQLAPTPMRTIADSDELFHCIRQR